MKKLKPFEKKFAAFETAMMRLYESRGSDSELVGLDQVLADAREWLAHGELGLVRIAVGAVVEMVASDVGTRLTRPVHHERCCFAALAMLDTMTSVVEKSGRYAN